MVVARGRVELHVLSHLHRLGYNNMDMQIQEGFGMLFQLFAFYVYIPDSHPWAMGSRRRRPGEGQWTDWLELLSNHRQIWSKCKLRECYQSYFSNSSSSYHFQPHGAALFESSSSLLRCCWFNIYLAFAGLAVVEM